MGNFPTSQAFLPITWKRVLVVVVAGLLLAIPVGAQQKGKSAQIWSKTFNYKVMGVLNASATKFSAPTTPGSFPVDDSSAVRAEDSQDSFKELPKYGYLHLVENPSGIVIFIVKDKGDDLALLAVDVETGVTRWEQKSLEPGMWGNFLTVGELVLAWVVKDPMGKSTRQDSILTAFDLRTGKLLWRNEDIQGTKQRFVGLPGQRVILVQHELSSLFKPGKGLLYAIDMDSGKTRWCLEQEHAYQMQFPNPKGGYQVVAQNPANLYTYPSEGGDLIVPTIAGTRMKPFFMIRSIDIESGKQHWEAPIPDEHSFVGSLYVSTDRVFFYRADREVRVLDRATGGQISTLLIPDGKDASGTTVGDPRHLYLDGDLLFIYYPGGKKYQLKVIDTKAGRQLWQTDSFRDALEQFTLAGDRVVFAEDTTITSLDKRTGRVIGTFDTKFKESFEFFSATSDGVVTVQTRNQIARFRADSWMKLFDTGPLAKTNGPTRVKLSQSSSGTFSAFLSGMSFGGLSGGLSAAQNHIDQMAKQKQVQDSAPSKQVAVNAAPSPASLHGVAMELLAVDVAEAGTGAGTQCMFIGDGPGGDDWVLAIDRGTGGKRWVCHYPGGTWTNRVIDDHYGIAIEMKKDEAVAVRYPIGEQERRRSKLIDAFNLATDYLGRGQAWEKAKANADAVQQFVRAEASLHAALALAQGLDEAGVRLSLADTYLRLTALSPDKASEYGEKARAELNAVLTFTSGRSDELSKAAAEAASAALGQSLPTASPTPVATKAPDALVVTIPPGR